MKTITLKKLTDTEQQVHQSIQKYFKYIDPMWHNYLTVDIDGSIWVWNKEPRCNGSGYWGRGRQYVYAP